MKGLVKTMSDISCEIIKDLLPLYADDICSQESKKTVEEHIKNCSNCSEELEKITDNKSEIRPASNDGEEFKRAGKKFKKTKKKAVIKGIIIGLVAVIVIGALLIPDFLVLFAKSQFVVTNPKVTMNIGNQRNGKEQIENIKINLPEESTAERKENDETVVYSITCSDSSETDNPRKITIIFTKNGTENVYDTVSSDKIVSWLENKGIKELGFNTSDRLDDYIYYLFSTEDVPKYNIFSSVGKKAAAFAYYYGYNLWVPNADGMFNYENEQYKSYGYMLSRMDEEGKTRSMYVFTICGRATIVFNGQFEKTEVESIMSSVVLE